MVKSVETEFLGRCVVEICGNMMIATCRWWFPTCCQHVWNVHSFSGKVPFQSTNTLDIFQMGLPPSCK